MALMERVAALLRANLNDLMDRAEDPEKMLKQLVLDMENQLLQVKTQVAISLADQHLLEKKLRDQEDAAAGWQRKAELAVGKGDDGLARAALQRALSHETMLPAFRAQVADGAAEAAALRATYTELQGKLAETQGRCDLLLAQHRRAQLVSKAQGAHAAAQSGALTAPRTETLNRMQTRISTTDAHDQAAKTLLAEGTLEDRFAALEKDDQVERLLAELKEKQNRLLTAG